MRAGIQSPDVMYIYNIRQMSDSVYTKTRYMCMMTDNCLTSCVWRDVFIHGMFLAEIYTTIPEICVCGNDGITRALSQFIACPVLNACSAIADLMSSIPLKAPWCSFKRHSKLLFVCPTYTCSQWNFIYFSNPLELGCTSSQRVQWGFMHTRMT